MFSIIICILLTFNDPIKPFFLDKKYFVPIEKYTTQIVNSKFLIQKLVSGRFLRCIIVQNKLTISFGTAIVQLSPHTQISNL